MMVEMVTWAGAISTCSTIFRAVSTSRAVPVTTTRLWAATMAIFASAMLLVSTSPISLASAIRRRNVSVWTSGGSGSANSRPPTGRISNPAWVASAASASCGCTPLRSIEIEAWSLAEGTTLTPETAASRASTSRTSAPWAWTFRRPSARRSIVTTPGPAAFGGTPSGGTGTTGASGTALAGTMRATRPRRRTRAPTLSASASSASLALTPRRLAVTLPVTSLAVTTLSPAAVATRRSASPASAPLASTSTVPSGRLTTVTCCACSGAAASGRLGVMIRVLPSRRASRPWLVRTMASASCHEVFWSFAVTLPLTAGSSTKSTPAPRQMARRTVGRSVSRNSMLTVPLPSAAGGSPPAASPAVTSTASAVARAQRPTRAPGRPVSLWRIILIPLP